MCQGSRGIDNDFRSSDALYSRFTAEEAEGGRLLAASIPYKNPSVNWSKYSKPWDVIFDHPKHGIARVLVRHLPTELPKEKTGGGAPKLHSFFPGHAPEALNYSHSEIWTFREGNKLDSPKLPEVVKKEFRAILSDRSVILRHPPA
jgi:hypothetical protein